jgi:hypothetical protein
MVEQSGLGEMPIGRIRQVFGLKSHQGRPFDIAGLSRVPHRTWTSIEISDITNPKPVLG